MATDPNFTPTYTTAVRVANRINVTKAGNTVIDASNVDALDNPTKDIIEDFIQEAEQDIDTKCARAWRETTKPDEVHPYYRKDYRRYYHSRAHNYIARLDLDYDAVQDFATGQGDKIEVMTSTGTYTDLVATGTAGSSPGDGDYYLNNKDGILYINNKVPIFGPEAFRITYRYGGDETPPSDIQKAATLLAAMSIMESKPDKYIKSQGDDGINIFEMFRHWQKIIDNTIKEYSKQSPARQWFL